MNNLFEFSKKEKEECLTMFGWTDSTSVPGLWGHARRLPSYPLKEAFTRCYTENRNNYLLIIELQKDFLDLDDESKIEWELTIRYLKTGVLPAKEHMMDESLMMLHSAVHDLDGLLEDYDIEP